MEPNLNQESKDNLENLIQQISLDQCCAFIGSGLSIPAGYPSWREVTKTLIDAAKTVSGVQLDGNEADLSILCGRCREIIGEEKYNKTLIECFNNAGKDDFRPIHQLIMQIPFHGFITTNYDQCLERAAGNLGKKVLSPYFPELDASRLREGHVFHIHGILDPANIHKTIGSVVLTEKDFQEAYQEREPLSALLGQLFEFHTVVFMGYGLNDYDLIKVMRSSQAAIARRRERELRTNIGVRRDFKHFILAHQDSNVRTEDVQELGLISIFYQGDSFRHTELEAILKLIRSRTTKISYPEPALLREAFVEE